MTLSIIWKFYELCDVYVFLDFDVAIINAQSIRRPSVY